MILIDTCIGGRKWDMLSFACTISSILRFDQDLTIASSFPFNIRYYQEMQGWLGTGSFVVSRRLAKTQYIPSVDV